MQVALAAREGEVERIRAEGERERERALAAAAGEWKGAEAIRLAAIEAEWRGRLSEAHAGRGDAPAGHSLSTGDDPELERAHADLAAMNAALTESAKAYEQFRAEAEGARERAKNDAESAILRAEIDWKNQEGARLQRAEMKWREENAGELAEAIRRYQAAEAALAQARPRGRGDDQDTAQMRDELVALHAALAERDNELAYARASLDQRGHQVKTFKGTAQRDAASRRRAAGGFMLQVAVTVGLVVATFVYYPTIVGLLPYEWQQSIANATASVDQAMGTVQPPTVAAAPAPTDSAPLVRSATVTHGANLRNAASAKAKALTLLPKGASVAILQSQGNWTEVRAEGGLQGWVFGSYLAEAPVADTSKSAKTK
jgi:NTP pyrophosphatase (non-canonical NTP hydrolase)